MYALNSIPQNNRIIKILIAGFLIITASATSALKEDVEKPVYINADSVLFNKTKGLAVYEGNVSIIQGTLEIKAHRIEINAPNNEIQRITATGNSVSFQQKMDDGKLAKGGANKLLYLVEGKKIVMDGNAVISQNNDKFSSNHIEYSTKTSELKAGRDKKIAGSKGRVKVIFYPSNKAK